MDFYDDEKRIAGKVNRVSALIFVGSQIGRKLQLRVRRFSGVRTISRFRLDIDQAETFRFYFRVTEGKAKIVLVNAFGVKTLIENTFEGEKSLFVSQGLARVRVVGQAASFDLRMERIA